MCDCVTSGRRLFCKRGTSALEGLHRAIRRVFSGFAVGPELGFYLLTEFFYDWNIMRGIDHRGESDFGHKNYQLLEELSLLQIEQDGVGIKGLRLTDDFTDTGEHFVYMREEKAAFDPSCIVSANIAAAADVADADAADGTDGFSGALIGIEASDLADVDLLLDDPDAGEAPTPVVIAYDEAAYLRLKPSHRFLARNQGLPRPAFLSRWPKRAELKLVLEIEEELAGEGITKIENKARSGGPAYAEAFQKKWAAALRAMELPDGHRDKRPDIGAGLLSPVAYADFMKMFGKWLQTKVSYAPMAESERSARSDYRDPVCGEPRRQSKRDGGKFARDPPKVAIEEGDPELLSLTPLAPIWRITIGAQNKDIAR